MVELDKFPTETYQLLVTLPYRVGLYVSMSDQSGGSTSEEKELQALENIVTFYVEDTLKSEFAQSVMLVTLQNKVNWPNWNTDIGNVPEECKYILGYLEDRLEARDLLAFKNNLLEIAVTVAMAYRESSTTSFADRIKSFFSPQKSANSNNQALNISKAEKTALNTLADTFGIPYKVA